VAKVVGRNWLATASIQPSGVACATDRSKHLLTSAWLAGRSGEDERVLVDPTRVDLLDSGSMREKFLGCRRQQVHGCGARNRFRRHERLV
jgi:hypothetical protein